MKRIKKIYKDFFEYEYCPEENQVVELDYNDFYKKHPESVFKRLCDMGIVQDYLHNTPSLLLTFPGENCEVNVSLVTTRLIEVLPKIITTADKIDWVNSYIQKEIDNLNEALESGIPEEELRNKFNFDHYQD